MAYKTPVSALVVIHTPDLQVLLLERADRKNFWQSVTGSIETGETPYEAAIREVGEETGLVATDYAFSDWQTSNVYEIYPHWRHKYDLAVNPLCLVVLEVPGQVLLPGHVRRETLRPLGVRAVCDGLRGVGLFGAGRGGRGAGRGRRL